VISPVVLSSTNSAHNRVCCGPHLLMPLRHDLGILCRWLSGDQLPRGSDMGRGWKCLRRRDLRGRTVAVRQERRERVHVEEPVGLIRFIPFEDLHHHREKEGEQVVRTCGGCTFMNFQSLPRCPCVP
jgi:hypothetical protein